MRRSAGTCATSYPAEVMSVIDANGGRPVGTCPHAAQGRRINGEPFPLEASVSRGKAGGRTFYTAVIRDVTERQRLETQYLRARQMGERPARSPAVWPTTSTTS